MIKGRNEGEMGRKKVEEIKKRERGGGWGEEM